MDELNNEDFTLYKNGDACVLILQKDRPIIFQDSNLDSLLREVKAYLERIS